MIRELLKIFSLIKKVASLLNSIKGFIHFINIDETDRLTNLKDKLCELSNYFESI
jgi:hypothetical protein